MSIAVGLSAAEIKETDTEGVVAADLAGDGDWELYRSVDWEQKAKEQQARKGRDVE